MVIDSPRSLSRKRLSELLYYIHLVRNTPDAITIMLHPTLPGKVSITNLETKSSLEFISKHTVNYAMAARFLNLCELHERPPCMSVICLRSSSIS